MEKGTMKIRLYLSGDDAPFPFLESAEVNVSDPAREPLHVAIVDGAMSSGMPGVAICQRLRDGSYTLIQTSGKGFLGALAPLLLKLKEKVDAVEAEQKALRERLDGTLVPGNDEEH